MNDKYKKNLKIFIILILILVIAFLLGGGLLSILIKSAEFKSIKNELMSESDFYRNQIMRQFDADFQTLNTLKGFVEFKKSSNELLIEGLNESNKSNKFIRMSLIYSDNTVYHATVDEDIKKVNLYDLHESLQESLIRSWEGNNSISKIFYDEDLEKNVMVVSVPIIEDDKVVGILAAYNDISEFQGILEASVMDKSYVHVITDEGEFLIRTKYRLSDESSKSIFTMKLKLLDEVEVRNALENQESYFSAFSKDGKKYSVYITPMNLHNWYLINVSPYYSIQSPLIALLNYSTLFYGVIVFIVAIFVIYSLQILKKNYKILEEMAYYDMLTGVLNLNRFKQVIEETIEKSSKCSVVRMNIKNFQLINDTFGENYADKLLCLIAYTISGDMKENEYCCRENADQYAILLQENDKEEIISRIHYFEGKIKKFFEDTRSSYDIRFSIGVCTENSNSKQMMSNALWAMKKAKELNESYVFYDEDLLDTIKVQKIIESSMHKALKENEFKLYLQPKYNINQNEIISAEALVRWIKPDGSIIYPNDFIPLFEKNGFCVELDLYMLELICKKLREWLDKGLEVYPISVNQTKLLFYKSDYVDRICEIVSKYNISPSYIILEILEGLAVDDSITFNHNIEKLHRNGFKVSLDDFGSGYSSLSNLNELNVDEIKIDKKFLDFSGDNSDIQKINLLRKIVSLVISLGCDVIMEGVETKEQVEILKSMNCKYAQGYYFSKPIASHEYEALLHYSVSNNFKSLEAERINSKIKNWKMYKSLKNTHD